MSIFKSRKILAATVAGLAVTGGVGAGIAASQDDSRASSFFDSVAKHLGISSDELEEATRAAAIDQVDAAARGRPDHRGAGRGAQVPHRVGRAPAVLRAGTVLRRASRRRRARVRLRDGPGPRLPLRGQALRSDRVPRRHRGGAPRGAPQRPLAGRRGQGRGQVRRRPEGGDPRATRGRGSTRPSPTRSSRKSRPTGSSSACARGSTTSSTPAARTACSSASGAPARASAAASAALRARRRTTAPSPETPPPSFPRDIGGPRAARVSGPLSSTLHTCPRRTCPGSDPGRVPRGPCLGMDPALAGRAAPTAASHQAMSGVRPRTWLPRTVRENA